MKGINSSTPKTFETFALLVVDVPTNNFTEIPILTHQISNGRLLNVELATHSEHMKPMSTITVMVPPFESFLADFSDSNDYGIQMQRFTFCVFLQDKLFLSFNNTNENVSSVVVGIGINGTQNASSREPIIIKFIIPKVAKSMAK